ncbi:MAG TPA: hypothetical protein VI977_02290 [archaeon]|nr:hypothetical protein [archaeon]
MKQEDFYKIVAGVSMLAVFVLSYGVFQLQSADAIINPQGGFAAQPAAVEKAKISLVTIKDSSRSDYIQLDGLVQQVKALDVSVVSEKSLEFSSAEAQQLIEKYGIEKIPAVLISGETKKVSALTGNWSSLGSVESDDTLVLRNVPPIFLELSSGKTRGLVNAIYLNVPDKNGVFPAVLFKQILGNTFGMAPAEEKTVDSNSSEGKQLIADFNLNKIPAVILSGDLNAYANFEEIWKQAGSKETDGNYVFRNLEILQGLKYFDLNSSQIVEAPKAA